MTTIAPEHETKTAGKDDTLFATVDLTDWLIRCQKADVPVVPATICPFSASSKAMLQGHHDELKAIDHWTSENWETKGYSQSIWRWTLCAPIPIKAAMSHPGLPVRLGSPLENIQDKRFQSILANCSKAGISTVTTVIRPWIQAAIEFDYPVEFRVFVTQSGTTSTSSYYTQRSLGKKWMPYAKKASSLAKLLRPFVPERVSYSADFLVTKDTKDKQILFLEGGPPPEFGGDPCLLTPSEIGNGRILL